MGNCLGWAGLHPSVAMVTSLFPAAPWPRGGVHGDRRGLLCLLSTLPVPGGSLRLAGTAHPGGLSLNLLVCGALLRPLRLQEDQSITTSPQHPSSSPLLSRLWSLFDLSLLRHWPFLTYTAAVTLFNAGYFIPYVHLVAHIQQKGFSEYQAALVMSLTALTDLLGRGVSGWVSDLRRVRLPHILALWTGLTGLSMLVIPLGSSYPILLALGLVYGFCSGAMTPVVFSLLPDIVGVGRIFELGLLQMIEAWGLLGSPLSGWLRDLTGDFTASFLVAGAFLLAGTLVLFALPSFFSCSGPQNQCPEPGPITNGTGPSSSSQAEPQNSTEPQAALVTGPSETVTFSGSGQNHSATRVEDANC
ncbi:monocarboxylate transporter 13-like [Acipenser oxyrinchus oxyrinchus]|uniref:Monocarboxylate transporter 13-like n=1 Tax=Acipenser oxyrinchus oxyrinchus TaxID=40147 RepID=A0AAD8CDP8_ACIOX|nr:monocarboxylate transporter 13-like [Acipenser oxyrinchus oxyrinchus]